MSTTSMGEASNVDVSMAARQYVAAGWKLVPIAAGSKGPRGVKAVGWNKPENCIGDAAGAARLRPGAGIGLAHAYSGTCAIDFDDLAKCRDWLANYLINVDRLLDADDAVQISSGRENRGKLLYKLPDGLAPLQIIQIEACGLELRCATDTGLTFQDVLPPSVHPKTNQPYRWAGKGDWTRLPVLPAELLDLWQELIAQLDPVRTGAGVPDGDPESDPVVRHLTKEGLSLRRRRDGTRFIACPFEDQHTTKGTVGDCGYFPARTGGYAQGHFKCLHAHCANRTDDEFLDGIGYDRHAAIAALFDVVVPETPPAPAGSAVGRPVAQDLPRFQRNKAGRIYAIINNLLMAVNRSDVCGWQIGYDTFRDEIMRSPPGTTDQWQSWTDTDYTELRARLEFGMAGFDAIGREMIRDAVALIAARNAFDSAQLWLGSIQWDGVKRIHKFAHTYMGCDDNPYTQAVSMYIWTALAGRILEPGCQVDMVPVLIGPQGLQKSSLIMNMAPHHEYYAEINFAMEDTDLARKLRGVVVAEVPELKGIAKDADHIKALITRRHENWVPKFKEMNNRYHRRCVIFGTGNKVDFLSDETGNRRFLPLMMGRIDIAALKRDRDQLWAEGAAFFSNVTGVDWAAAERLAIDVHEHHLDIDAWEEPIGDWINAEEEYSDNLRKNAGFKMSDLLFGALALSTKDHSRIAQLRVGAILRKFGLERKIIWTGGKSVRRWILTHVAANYPSDADKGNENIPF